MKNFDATSAAEKTYSLVSSCTFVEHRDIWCDPMEEALWNLESRYMNDCTCVEVVIINAHGDYDVRGRLYPVDTTGKEIKWIDFKFNVCGTEAFIYVSYIEE